MKHIVYSLGDKLYLNLTNRCPCACTFCIRQNGDTVGDSDSLWLEREPTADEVVAALSSWDLSAWQELVFCGYGEPTCALEVLLATCRYVRGCSSIPIRLNTNGLGDLVNGKPVAPLLAELVDTVSVSLNTADAVRYEELCHPQFGQEAFDAMLRFAVHCRAHVPEVVLSVVDVLSPEELEACRLLAEQRGLPLRVRHFEE